MFVHLYVYIGKDIFAHADLRVRTQSCICVCEFICVCMCVYKEGVFSCRLLKLTVSTKGWVPTLLYGGRVRVGHAVEENTGLSATRPPLYCRHGDIQAPAHQRTNNTAQLYDCGPSLSPSYLLLGEACCSAMRRCRHVNFESGGEKREVGGWGGSTKGWIKRPKTLLFTGIY